MRRIQVEKIRTYRYEKKLAKERENHRKKQAKIKDLSVKISNHKKKLPPIRNERISVSPHDRPIENLRTEYEQLKNVFASELKETLRQVKFLTSEIASANKRLMDAKCEAGTAIYCQELGVDTGREKSRSFLSTASPLKSCRLTNRMLRERASAESKPKFRPIQKVTFLRVSNINNRVRAQDITQTRV